MRRQQFVLAALLLCASQAMAQTPVAELSAGELHLRRLLAVPFGALPPMAMLMPASRDHNYWVGRVQGGSQWNDVIGDLATGAAGLDLQWRGGSSFGLTAGYQRADCEKDVTGCGSHALFGARARVNLVTGGPTFATLVGDNSATTTMGADIGFGYAPSALDGRNACALDLGAPVSISLFQRVRLLSYVTPGIAWDIRCPLAGSTRGGASTFLAAGLGIQQLRDRGLDISVGAQRIFRRGSGFQLGINVVYVRLPR